MNIHSKALDSMFDDMDEMEQKKMFGGHSSQEPDGDEKGVSITISVTPGGDVDMGEDKEMNKGGMAYHTGGTVPSPELEADIFDSHGNPDPEYKKGEMGMAKGGMVEPKSEPTPTMGETEDLSLPPFLRKKKKG